MRQDPEELVSHAGHGDADGWWQGLFPLEECLRIFGWNVWSWLSTETDTIQNFQTLRCQDVLTFQTLRILKILICLLEFWSISCTSRFIRVNGLPKKWAQNWRCWFLLKTHISWKQNKQSMVVFDSWFQGLTLQGLAFQGPEQIAGIAHPRNCGGLAFGAGLCCEAPHLTTLQRTTMTRRSWVLREPVPWQYSVQYDQYVKMFNCSSSFCL